MDEEGVDRAFDEGELQPAAGKRALLDRRAVEEGLEPVARVRRAKRISGSQPGGRSASATSTRSAGRR